MPGEIGFAPMECLGELRLDGVFGDAEAPGDFPVGEVFKFSEDKDFAAPGRESGDGRRQEIAFLPTAHGLGHGGSLVEDA